MRFIQALVTIPVAVLFSATAFAAGSEAVTLTATGNVAVAPTWQDGASADLPSMAFDFAGNVAGTAAADVDSAAFTAKLVNAVAYPATVSLVRPTTCTIAANPITDAHVHLLFNGTPKTSDTSFTIPDNGNQAFKLRFAAAGNYGDKSGAVSCSVAGSLTYTY